jgi:transcriptional regulator with XRE-family HTH domain
MTASGTSGAPSRRAATRAQRDETHRQRQLEELARMIRSHRTARRLSQHELAGRTGTRNSAISRIESGRQGITVDTLQRIAQALSVDLIVTFETGGRQRIRRSVRLDRLR